MVLLIIINKKDISFADTCAFYVCACGHTFSLIYCSDVIFDYNINKMSCRLKKNTNKRLSSYQRTAAADTDDGRHHLSRRA